MSTYDKPYVKKKVMDDFGRRKNDAINRGLMNHVEFLCLWITEGLCFFYNTKFRIHVTIQDQIRRMSCLLDLGTKSRSYWTMTTAIFANNMALLPLASGWFFLIYGKFNQPCECLQLEVHHLFLKVSYGQHQLCCPNRLHHCS